MPASLSTRWDVFQHLNGLAAERREELETTQRLRRPLVKSYLLEHVARARSAPVLPVDRIFSDLDVQVCPIDDDFFRVQGSVIGNDGQLALSSVGFLEKYDERFFAFYTDLRTAQSDPLVRAWVIDSPHLDHVWLSGQTLQTLWDCDISGRAPDRYGRIVFLHESVYDMPEDATTASPADELDEAAEEESVESGDWSNEDRPEPERRRAKFEMCDRVSKIGAKLATLQKTYEPLFAINALRFPSYATRGAHDLYDFGKLTNRSDSFEDHRNHVRHIYRLYKSLLEKTEQLAWLSFEERVVEQKQEIGLRGVPLIVRFEEPLNKPTFDRWVRLAVSKRSRFRIWGEPLWLGPTKVQIYGADRHLWQPLYLEMTEKHLVAILPKGTCGNTFHRLVTNVQRYLSPRIHAYLGAKEFSTLLSDSMRGIVYQDEGH